MAPLVSSSTALGRALRDARRAQGLTQNQVAERAGIGQPTLSNVERGVSSVTLSTLLRILAVLRLELRLEERPDDAATGPWEDA